MSDGMRIVSVEPKDVWITFEMSIGAIKKVLNALEHSRIEYDGDSEPDMAQAADFLKDTFFKLLADVAEDVKAHG